MLSPLSFTGEGRLEQGGKERKVDLWAGGAFGQCRAPGGKEQLMQLVQL